MEEKKAKVKFNVLAIICIIIFSFVLAPITLQNDTFYTIKIGEHIINNGIDMKDPFSWHEDLPYTYPHWAYDTATYLVYHLGEITGIQNGGMLFIYLATAILACVLGVLIYITCCRISKNNLISFFLTMFTMFLIRDFIAARAQLVTFILFVLTILFIESYIETNKKRYLFGLIIISIAIANIHVAVWPFFFVLFMPYIAEYIIACLIEKNIFATNILHFYKSKIKKYERKLEKAKKEEKRQKLELKLKSAKEDLNSQKQIVTKIIEKEEKKRKNPYKLKIEKKDNVKWLILVMVICAFTGLLTPLGNTPYTYLIKTMQGNTMNSISEHQPLTLYKDVETMVVLILFFGILIFTDTKIKLRDFFMLFGLIFLSFMSRRQISMLFIIGIYIFAKFLNYLVEKYDKEGCKRAINMANTLIGRTITISIVILVSVCFVREKMNDKFINEKKYPVEASTWILENLDIKNMHLYNEYNYGSYLLYRGIPVFIDSRADLYAPEFNEGRDIFSDYINISTLGTYYETKFDEYEITHVIVINNSKLNMFLSRNENYTQLYKDSYFVVYERNVD